MLSIVKHAIFDSTTMGYIGSPFGLGLSCQLWVGLKMLKILPSMPDDPHDQTFTTHSLVEVFLF